MLVVKRGPAAKEKDTSLLDWNSFLHSYWLEKMTGSSFYGDAKILHGNGCRCCTRSRNLREVQKRNE